MAGITKKIKAKVHDMRVEAKLKEIKREVARIDASIEKEKSKKKNRPVINKHATKLIAEKLIAARGSIASRALQSQCNDGKNSKSFRQVVEEALDEER